MSETMSMGGLFGALEREPLAGSGGVDVGGVALAAEVGWFSTPLGWMRAVSDGSSVLGLEFEDGEGARAEWSGGGVLGVLGEELGAYFGGEAMDFSVPLRLSGTPFQVLVWRALMEIPYGASVSYGDLAERLGVKNGQRAVGMANRTNPVAVVVPCHRVVQATGALCGYAGGLWRKQRLLGLEAGQRGLF